MLLRETRDSRYVVVTAVQIVHTCLRFTFDLSRRTTNLRLSSRLDKQADIGLLTISLFGELQSWRYTQGLDVICRFSFNEYCQKSEWSHSVCNMVYVYHFPIVLSLSHKTEAGRRYLAACHGNDCYHLRVNITSILSQTISWFMPFDVLILLLQSVMFAAFQQFCHSRLTDCCKNISVWTRCDRPPNCLPCVNELSACRQSTCLSTQTDMLTHDVLIHWWNSGLYSRIAYLRQVLILLPL